MSELISVGELLPGVLGELVDRAGHGYARWAEQVAATGYASTRCGCAAASSTPTR